MREPVLLSREIWPKTKAFWPENPENPKKHNKYKDFCHTPPPEGSIARFLGARILVGAGFEPLFGNYKLKTLSSSERAKRKSFSFPSER